MKYDASCRRNERRGGVIGGSARRAGIRFVKYHKRAGPEHLRVYE